MRVEITACEYQGMRGTVIDTQVDGTYRILLDTRQVITADAKELEPVTDEGDYFDFLNESETSE